MLRMASFRSGADSEIGRRFADHQREWLAGEAYRFAVELEGKIVASSTSMALPNARDPWAIGSIGQPGVDGHAFEAARRRDALRLRGCRPFETHGRACADNPASGRVLAKLGFSSLDTVARFSRPRGSIMQRRYVLTSLRA